MCLKLKIENDLSFGGDNYRLVAQYGDISLVFYGEIKDSEDWEGALDVFRKNYQSVVKLIKLAISLEELKDEVKYK